MRAKALPWKSRVPSQITPLLEVTFYYPAVHAFTAVDTCQYIRITFHYPTAHVGTAIDTCQCTGIPSYFPSSLNVQPIFRKKESGIITTILELSVYNHFKSVSSCIIPSLACGSILVRMPLSRILQVHLLMHSVRVLSPVRSRPTIIM